MRCFGKTFGCDFHDENRFATLDAITIPQRRIFNSLTVEKCSIRRSQITEERVRWIHLEQTMITGEKTIVGQAKMSFRISTDQEAVVLRERKDAAFVWAGSDFQVDLHYRS